MGCILSLIFELLKSMVKFILSQALLFIAFFVLICFGTHSLFRCFPDAYAWSWWILAVPVNLILSIKIGWPLAGGICNFIYDIFD